MVDQEPDAWQEPSSELKVAPDNRMSLELNKR